MEDLIIGAIDRKLLIAFEYNGQPRTVKPHALYRKDQLRHVVLHAWQTAGRSNSRTPPCWGNFHLDQIGGLKVLAETFFGAQYDFNPRRFRHLIHSL